MEAACEWVHRGQGSASDSLLQGLLLDIKVCVGLLGWRGEYPSV